MKQQTEELKKLLLMKENQPFIFLAVLVIGIAFVWLVFSSNDVTISITDTNKTPNIAVNVYNAETFELLLSGNTNNRGVFEGEVQVKRNEKIQIICEKKGYVINPWKIVIKPSRTHHTFITATILDKEIEFRVKNSVSNIDVYGINEKGSKQWLGKTNFDGVLRVIIQKKDFKKIKFKYTLSFTDVFAEYDDTYFFENVPSKINLKAIPNQVLDFNFNCKELFTNKKLSDVNIHADSIADRWLLRPILGVTNKNGATIIKVLPTKQDGPFIGDVIKWKVKKENYGSTEKIESIIDVGIFKYPDPLYAYAFILRREYEMSIYVMEEDFPLSNAEILINGETYLKTDKSGKVLYKYYDKDINKKVRVEVRKEGLSASYQTIRLKKISKSLTFNVETIHLFLKLVDSQTNEPITGLLIKRNGKETGDPVGQGRVKLIFPRIGDYSLQILDPKKEHLEKTYPLKITQRTIGKENIVKIDPITGISFTLIDKTAGNALAGVHVFRGKKEVGTTDKAGRYAEVYYPDPGNYYTYSLEKDHYLTVKKRIYRSPGLHKGEFKLEQLSAIIILKDEVGDPASNVEVFVGNKSIGTSDAAGKLQFSPRRLEENYNMKFVSLDELYHTKKEEFYFAYNYMKPTFILARHSWIEMHFTEPGGDPLPGVHIISSTGETGRSDTSGVFRFKVDENMTPVDFSFTKPRYEKISKKIIPKKSMVTKILMPRLQAYFYVVDSRTGQPVPDLQVTVDGEKQSFTDPSGKANILPKKKPSNLTLYIGALDGSYIPLTKKVKYVDKDLGQFEIKKRPIEIRVSLHWNTGAPVTKGTIEIDMPYQRYKLKSRDRGAHTFESYSRTINPSLTIKVTTPSGQSFERTHQIILPTDKYVFSVDVALILEPKPNVTVLIDEGVRLQIFDDADSLIANEFGDYTSDFPDFGIYTFVRSGDGFVESDTTTMIIDQSEQTIDLTRQPVCAEADSFYNNGLWQSFLDKVEQLTEKDECFCDMNKKAAEVSMDNENDYAGALKFYKKITYSTKPCVINKEDPNIDPYVHLRMLECSVNSEKYEDGIREAYKFDGLVQLLGAVNKKQSINKKDYLLGILMVDEYWRLCEKRKSVTLRKAKEIKQKLDDIRKEAIEHLDKYEKTKKSTPSLQVKLMQIKNGCN